MQKSKKKAKVKIPHTFKPNNMDEEQWQKALRKQIAADEKLKVIQLPIHNFDDFVIKNTTKNTAYRVTVFNYMQQEYQCTCLDYKTNQLGTCKHIETTIAYINRKKELKDNFKNNTVSPITQIYCSYKGTPHLKIKYGSENKLLFEKIFAPYTNDKEEIAINFFGHADKVIAKAYKASNSFNIKQDAMEYIVQKRSFILRQALFTTLKQYIPKDFKTKLMPYQKKGVAFICKAGKCILADDMGLGKTIQAIASAQLLLEQNLIKSVLIIAPTSLVYQWENEIKKFTSQSVLCIEGVQHVRKGQYENTNFTYKIISYNKALNDIELIKGVEPDMIILDEAQRVKNWETKISAGIKKLQAPYKLVLTGTPIENKVQDLYSIIQFIEPTILPSLYEFGKMYEVKNDSGKVIGYKNLDNLAKFINPFLLRRKKQDVLKELPERTDRNLFVPLTNKQRNIHDSYVDEIAKIIARWKTRKFLSEEDRRKLMIFLGNMRMVCNSTFILDQETNYQTKIDELFVLLNQIWEAGNEKVVIFSQWERFTRLIASILEQEKIKFVSLHGGVPSNKRKAIIDTFQTEDDCKVFLSTDAGGVGLNLQAGSVVINMDLPWNPAVLEQRIGRVYRYGQNRNVSVINFVAAGTIEHGMLERLRFKSALAAGILDNGDANVFLNEEQTKSFMQNLENLFDSNAMKEKVENVPDRNYQVFDIDKVKNTKVEDEPTINKETKDNNIKANSDSTNIILPNTDEFITNTGNFLNQLGQILSNEKATDELVNKITDTDEHGNTYLKIPIANKNVITNLFKLFSNA
jgi:superfamily II DNA or RNA helicase